MNARPGMGADLTVTIEEYVALRLRARLREAIEIEEGYVFHQAWWGVPCGPTLSMLTWPNNLRGINAALSSVAVKITASAIRITPTA